MSYPEQMVQLKRINSVDTYPNVRYNFHPIVPSFTLEGTTLYY